MTGPLTKSAECFLKLWHMSIIVTEETEAISLDAGMGILIGICEDKILIRCGNNLTKWVSLTKRSLKFYLEE